MLNRVSLLSLLLIACLGAGCSGKSLQDRHYYSRLVIEDDKIFFEATATPEYPLESEAAETVRGNWLAQWLRLRGVCPRGHKVVSRQRIGPADNNPYRHDLRYTVECEAP